MRAALPPNQHTSVADGASLNTHTVSPRVRWAWKKHKKKTTIPVEAREGKTGT